MVEISEMRWALVASQYRSLRQAAATLNVRQSTLSRRLRDMECRLGATLFERTPGGTRPTAAGQEFLLAAKRIVDEVDSAFLRLKCHCRGERGRLVIGVCAALSTGNLRATLMDYLHLFPEVNVCMVDRSRVHLLSDLATDAVDVVIMMGNSPNWAGRILPLWNERVVIALPREHPLCKHQIIQWNELEGLSWLISQRDPGPEFHELLIKKFGYSGLSHVMEHDVGVDRLLSLVGTGLGATLVAEGATGAVYPGVVYREIYGEGSPTRLNFVACWREGNCNPTLGPFLAMFQKRYPDLDVSSVATNT